MPRQQQVELRVRFGRAGDPKQVTEPISVHPLPIGSFLTHVCFPQMRKCEEQFSPESARYVPAGEMTETRRCRRTG